MERDRSSAAAHHSQHDISASPPLADSGGPANATSNVATAQPSSPQSPQESPQTMGVSEALPSLAPNFHANMSSSSFRAHRGSGIVTPPSPSLNANRILSSASAFSLSLSKSRKQRAHGSPEPIAGALADFVPDSAVIDSMGLVQSSCSYVHVPYQHISVSLPGHVPLLAPVSSILCVNFTVL